MLLYYVPILKLILYIIKVIYPLIEKWQIYGIHALSLSFPGPNILIFLHNSFYYNTQI
jgi:hypothetical protein